MTQEIVLPVLSAPYDGALSEAVGIVLAGYSPVGIIAAGSILRGQGGPQSDLDLYVIHAAPFRQRLQRRFCGVPCEIFINPPGQVRRYFVEEHGEGRPITAHMLATGFVVLDRDPVVLTLRSEAATWLATPPNPSDEALRWRRYLVVDLLDNARDVIADRPADADLLLHEAVRATIDLVYLSARRHVPRAKELVSGLLDVDPEVADLAVRYYAAAGSPQRLALAAALARQALGADTFFEWDLAPDPVAL